MPWRRHPTSPDPSESTSRWAVAKGALSVPAAESEPPGAATRVQDGSEADEVLAPAPASAAAERAARVAMRRTEGTRCMRVHRARRARSPPLSGLVTTNVQSGPGAPAEAPRAWL